MNTGYNKYNLEASFKKHLLAENISHRSIKNYLSDLRYFLGWSHSHLRKNGKIADLSPDKKNIDINVVIITQFNYELVKTFKTQMIESKLPRQSINRRLSTLRKFGYMCVNNRWLNENPAYGVKSVSTVATTDIDSILLAYRNHLHEQKTNLNEVETVLLDLKQILLD